MSEQLGKTFKSGDPAPESGAYQLVGDRPVEFERTDYSRVVRVEQGEPLPPHPDKNGPAEWRFVRLAKGPNL